MKIKMSSVSLNTVDMFAKGAAGEAQLICLSCGNIRYVEISLVTSSPQCPNCGGVRSSLEFPAPKVEVSE